MPDCRDCLIRWECPEFTKPDGHLQSNCPLVKLVEKVGRGDV
jgi:hypothetical protein